MPRNTIDIVSKLFSTHEHAEQYTAAVRYATDVGIERQGRTVFMNRLPSDNEQHDIEKFLSEQPE